MLPNREFFEVTESIRGLKRSELVLGEGRRIEIVRAKRGDTFESLAQTANLEQYAVDQLRLINGMYPNGQPSVGQALKIIK